MILKRRGSIDKDQTRNPFRISTRVIANIDSADRMSHENDWPVDLRCAKEAVQLVRSGGWI